MTDVPQPALEQRIVNCRYRNTVWKAVFTAAIFFLLGTFGRPAMAAESEPASKSDVWSKVKNSLFAERPIMDAGSLLQLDAPVRAEDAATVPIAIRTQSPQTREHFIKTLYLVIDKNPSPIAGIFHLTPEIGKADLETRVRIEEYSTVRVIAEMNDGSLLMTTRFVKASGGCSAPAGKDQAAALARLGKMKILLDEAVTPGKPVQAQVMISHPNSSGLAMDQLTRLYVPPHYVRKLDVSYAGKTVLSADIDFSISENPNFRFYFVPQNGGELTATAVDSQDLVFNSKLKVGSVQ